MANLKSKFEKAANKIVGQAVEFVSDCTQATADFLETNSEYCRAKIALADLSEKKTNLLTELGYFAYYGETADERVEKEVRMELDQVCADIEVYENILKELTATVDEDDEFEEVDLKAPSKDYIFCGDCGAQNPAAKSYCLNCGSALK